MRVEDLYPPSVRSAGSPGQAEKSTDTDRGRAEGLADLVSLSRLSQALLLSRPDQARLEEVRLLLASGGYRILAPLISRRIVDFYLEAEGQATP